MAEEPSSRRESSEDRRCAIARAARQLIAEKGMEGLRTRDIADRVGINIATLHYHVPSKQDLVGLVVSTMRDEFRSQSILRPRAHLPAVEQLEHEFYDFRELMQDHAELIMVLGELTERARRDPVVREGIAPLQGRWHAMMADIIVAGRAEGSFRADIDPEAAATMLIGALIHFARRGNADGEDFDRLCAELRRAVRNPTTEPAETVR